MLHTQPLPPKPDPLLQPLQLIDSVASGAFTAQDGVDMVYEEGKGRIEFLNSQPCVLVRARLISWGWEWDMVEVFPDKPTWYGYEAEAVGSDWIIEEIYGAHYGSWGADRDSRLFLETGLVPGDELLIRVWKPHYTTDYWGETDCTHNVELVGTTRGIKKQRTRNLQVLDFIRDVEQTRKRVEKQQRWFQRYVRRPENLFLWSCSIGWANDELRVWATLDVRRPRIGKKRHWTPYPENVQLLRVDLGIRELQALGSYKGTFDTSLLVVKNLKEAAIKELGITPEQFDSIPKARRHW